VKGSNELQKNVWKKLFLLGGRKCEDVCVQHGRDFVQGKGYKRRR